MNFKVALSGQITLLPKPLKKVSLAARIIDFLQLA
jgi:hypothetical protein